jgi:MFS family permease
MLKLNGVGRLGLRLGPTGLALGTRRLHYAWVIVAVASLMGMISSSVRFATSVLVPHLRDPAGLGWGYRAIAFAFTLQWLISGLVSPWVGWLGDRYGVRRTLVLGALLFIAGMLLTGTMTHLWQFYLYFGILLGIATTVFQILLVSGVTLWFRRYLGIAVGALWAFQGLGTIFLIPLMAMVFNLWGLQWAFWLPGLVGGALMLWLIRPFYNEPAAIGLRPLGAPGDEPIRSVHTDDAAQIRIRVFLRQAQRTATFWNLIGIHFWGCAGQILSMSSWWRSPWTVACRTTWRWVYSSPTRWSAPSPDFWSRCSRTASGANASGSSVSPYKCSPCSSCWWPTKSGRSISSPSSSGSVKGARSLLSPSSTGSTTAMPSRGRSTGGRTSAMAWAWEWGR